MKYFILGENEREYRKWENEEDGASSSFKIHVLGWILLSDMGEYLGGKKDIDDDKTSSTISNEGEAKESKSKKHRDDKKRSKGPSKKK